MRLIVLIVLIIFNRKDLADPIKLIKYSNLGDIIACCTSSQAIFFNTSTLKEVSRLENLKGLQDVSFSPSDTLLCTYQKNCTGKIFICVIFHLRIVDLPNNLKLWSIFGSEPAKVLWDVPQKVSTNWIPRFSKDETLVAVLCNGKLIFYDTKVNEVIRAQQSGEHSSISAFTITGSSKNLKVCCFFKKSSNQPATVKLFNYPNFIFPLCSKAFFNVDKVDFIQPAHLHCTV